MKPTSRLASLYYCPAQERTPRPIPDPTTRSCSTRSPGPPLMTPRLPLRARPPGHPDLNQRAMKENGDHRISSMHTLRADNTPHELRLQHGRSVRPRWLTERPAWPTPRQEDRIQGKLTTRSRPPLALGKSERSSCVWSRPDPPLRAGRQADAGLSSRGPAHVQRRLHLSSTSRLVAPKTGLPCPRRQLIARTAGQRADGRTC